MTETQPGTSVPRNFELMTNEDRLKILQKLKDVPRDQVAKFVYENKRKEWALTYEATKWIVREMADKGEAIRTDGHPKVERCVADPEWMTCTVLGKRVKVDREGKSEMLLDTNIGSARSWIKAKLRDGTVIPDEFWFSKVVSKATRNLQQSMIPTDFKKAIVARLLEIQAGKAGGPPANKPPQNAPPQGQARTPAQQGAAGAPAPQGHAGTSPASQAGQAGTSPASQSQARTPAQPGAAGAPAGQQAQKPAQGQATQKPPAQQQPAQQPAQKPSQGAQPPRGQSQQTTKSPNDATIETIQQHFNAVLQAFAGTNDRVTLQKVLKALTGRTLITELERELMVELGPLLRRKVKGELKWNGTSLHEPSGDQLWPKHVDQPEPPFEDPPPQEEGPPPSDADIPLF